MKINQLKNDYNELYKIISNQIKEIPDSKNKYQFKLPKSNKTIDAEYKNTIKNILDSTKKLIEYPDYTYTKIENPYNTDEYICKLFFMNGIETDDTRLNSLLNSIRENIRNYKFLFNDFKSYSKEKFFINDDYNNIKDINKYEIKLTSLNPYKKYRFIAYNLSKEYAFYISDTGKNKQSNKIKISGEEIMIMEL